MDFEFDRDEWTQDNISEIENRLLQNILECRTPEAVEAAMTYARFLSSIGITPENYPIFLLILDIENHWVIDALIGDRDPFLLLSPIQPNEFIVSRVFRMMTRWPKGGIYGKNLSVILGVLQAVYSSPRDGYRIYRLKISDVNAMGKHLDKDKGQDDPLNRAILEVLEKISELEDRTDPDMEEVARHAAAVRNAFFDDRKRMDEVIPPVLLVAKADRQEVAPRRQVPLRDAGLPTISAASAGSPTFESSTGNQESPREEPEDREAVGA
ncbi:MAG TPA: hypothetical protein RMF84_18585 [Polyangiaceae bacterium LLY-WYZ-14_1]|jgi:hypothetical protein|nr:hypothetical protein [Polyangiaceae bacterium LLY-WYZ-14_1]